jgi:hypothetical protein
MIEVHGLLGQCRELVGSKMKWLDGAVLLGQGVVCKCLGHLKGLAPN